MATTTKLDLFKKHKAEYVAPKKPVLVKIGPVKYLSIEGRGEPATASFQASVGALFAVAFTIKMTRKTAGKGDYKVAGLEGLWWGPKGNVSLLDQPPKTWRWRLLVRTPTFVSARDLAKAQKDIAARGKVPEVAKVKLETIREGRCVQALHVGSYDKELPLIEAMEHLAEEQGLKPRGMHHEIYLSDPRRVPPGKLRTILRHSVR